MSHTVTLHTEPLRNGAHPSPGLILHAHNRVLHTHTQAVAPCISEAEIVLKRLPELRDRVELLQDYETHQQSVADLQILLTELTESYSVTVK